MQRCDATNVETFYGPPIARTPTQKTKESVYKRENANEAANHCRNLLKRRGPSNAMIERDEDRRFASVQLGILEHGCIHASHAGACNVNVHALQVVDEIELV